MQIVFHIGAHCTDEGQIQACLTKNQTLLVREGIVVPSPATCRPILRETMSYLEGEPANDAMQELMLNSILTEDHPQRIIFSNEAFLSGILRILDHGTLYPDAGDKFLELFNLFPNREVEFCLAIRNPATFLPACFARSKTTEFEDFTSNVDLQSLRWSDVLARIRDRIPNAVFKVWSNEDTPFIWHELIREITDCDHNAKLEGLDEFLKSIMLDEGFERMQHYLKIHPPANEIQRRRILSAFLDKFEIEDDDSEFDASYWTDEYENALTDAYEEDLFVIERMPGVQFISP